MSLSTTSTRFLNTSRDSDTTTSLGSLCHCSTTLSEQKSFLISNLNLSSYCCYLGEETDPTSPQPPFRSLQKAIRSPLSLLFFRLNNPSSLTRSPSDLCSRLLTAVLPFSAHTPGPPCLSCSEATKTVHSGLLMNLTSLKPHSGHPYCSVEVQLFLSSWPGCFLEQLCRPGCGGAWHCPVCPDAHGGGLLALPSPFTCAATCPPELMLFCQDVCTVLTLSVCLCFSLLYLLASPNCGRNRWRITKRFKRGHERIQRRPQNAGKCRVSWQQRGTALGEEMSGLCLLPLMTACSSFPEPEEQSFCQLRGSRRTKEMRRKSYET